MVFRRRKLCGALDTNEYKRWVVGKTASQQCGDAGWQHRVDGWCYWRQMTSGDQQITVLRGSG